MKILKNFFPRLKYQNIDKIISNHYMIKKHNAKDDVLQLISLLKIFKIKK